MYRTPQLALRTPQSTTSNRHTASNMSNLSEIDHPQRKLDDLTR